MSDVFITGAARTPMGGLQGELAGATASELGGVALRAALGDVAPQEVIMGNVLSAGQGQAPARQAGFAAGFGEDIPATTLNKMCGSGMKAVMIAADEIALGRSTRMAAGGMESMSNAPYLLPAMRRGARLGHKATVDHMFLDGLEDAYDKGRLMGTFAEDCAETFQLSREAQDAYALESLARAQRAEFADEIAEVTLKARGGTTVISTDEQPRNARPDKIPHLKPVFRENGTVTPANASSISDGAAAVALASATALDMNNLTPRARIVGHATHAQAPGWFTTAPIPATLKLLERIGWSVSDVDLWEVNEAFAVVPMAFMRETGVPHDILNINGGACALGHPIGASGARIIVTLLNALERHDLKRGVAAICIGGGEGTAIAIERV